MPLIQITHHHHYYDRDNQILQRMERNIMAAIDDLKAALADYFADVEALIVKAGQTPPDDSAALAEITESVKAAKAKVDAVITPPAA